MHYAYFIIIGASLGLGWFAKVIYDYVTSPPEGLGVSRNFFRRVDNKDRKFGEDPWYQWLEGTEYGDLAFTDEDIEKGRTRGRKQANDLKVDGKPFSPPRNKTIY